MTKIVMKSKGAVSHSSEKKHRWILSAAAVLLICCLAFVGAVGAEEVAEIDGKGRYASIQAAVEAAENGDTVKVIKNHNLNCNDVQTLSIGSSSIPVLIIVNENITIDLNGYTVTADYSGDGSFTYITSVIWVSDGFKLTMTDSSATKTGTLHVKTTDSSKNNVKSLLRNHNSQDNEGGEIDKCSLVINGGSYIIDFGKVDTGSPGSIVYSENDNNTLVTGGTFRMGNIGAGSNGSPWILDASYNDANQIVVTGGTFNADVNHQHWEYEVYVPKEYALCSNGDNTWTVVDAVTHVTEHHRKYPNNNNDNLYSREIGYATVGDAVSATNTYVDPFPLSNDQETITLLKDAELEETLAFTKSTIFNMNGKKIIWKGGANDNILTVSGDGKTLTINSFNIIREGYEINKWKIDDTEYDELPENDASSVVVTQSLSIAEPQANTYTVTFNANGGEGTMADQPFTYDEEKKINKNTFTRDGYTFAGWAESTDGIVKYTDEQFVKNLTTINNGVVTLYANWTANPYTVTFNPNGGSVTPESKTVTYGSPYGELPIPAEREGYTFKGWYNTPYVGGGTEFTVESIVMSPNDHTLHAQWEEIPSEEPTYTSSGGGGEGNYLSYPRTTTNGGLVDFGSSKVVKALMLPEGSSDSVVLKVDTIEKWPKELETEYTFDISVEKLGEGMAYIHFEIPESTLESLGITPADICAYHLVDDVWVKLITTYEVKDGTVFYEAETDSFSPFKLVIEEGAAEPKAEETEPVIPPTEEPEDKPQEELPPIEPPVQPTEPESPSPILAVLAGLGAAAVLRRK